MDKQTEKEMLDAKKALEDASKRLDEFLKSEKEKEELKENDFTMLIVLCLLLSVFKPQKPCAPFTPFATYTPPCCGEDESKN